MFRVNLGFGTTETLVRLELPLVHRHGLLPAIAQCIDSVPPLPLSCAEDCCETTSTPGRKCEFQTQRFTLKVFRCTKTNVPVFKDSNFQLFFVFAPW
jgi:hypothetical protein